MVCFTRIFYSPGRGCSEDRDPRPTAGAALFRPACSSGPDRRQPGQCHCLPTWELQGKSTLVTRRQQPRGLRRTLWWGGALLPPLLNSFHKGEVSPSGETLSKGKWQPTLLTGAGSTSLLQIEMRPKSHSGGPAGKVSPWRQALLTEPSLQKGSQDRYKDNIKEVRFALTTSASSVLRIPGPTLQALGPVDHAHLLDSYHTFPILSQQCLSHQTISSSNRVSTVSGVSGKVFTANKWLVAMDAQDWASTGKKTNL